MIKTKLIVAKYIYDWLRLFRSFFWFRLVGAILKKLNSLNHLEGLLFEKARL